MSSPLKVSMLISMHNDLDAAIKFYQNLGLDLKFHVKDQWAEFDLNGIKFGLAHTTAELPERHTGIVLEVPNLQQTYQELVAKGVRFVKEPVEAAHGNFASFIDTGNNVIDLYEPTPERLKQAIEHARQEQARQASENK
jgi:predicted enzyme related to lactoylglutathione lyase